MKMQFNGFNKLLPYKFYLSIFNLILTVMLSSGIHLFISKLYLNKDAYYFLIFIYTIAYFDNNIICGCYWKRKKEFESYLAYLIATIINILVILICLSKEIDFVYIFYLIIQIPIIYFFVFDILDIEIIVIFFLIVSIFKCFFQAYTLFPLLKCKDSYNPSYFRLLEIFCSFLCYGGWILFGLIIGDIYCIISYGLLFLCFLLYFLTGCWYKFSKKNKRNENNKEESQQELTSNNN